MRRQPRPARPPRRSAGFTLVEVLVALALMALLAGMAWQGLASVADAREVSTRSVDRTLQAGTVVAQWEQDLARIHDTGVVPAISFDGATLRLVRRQAGGVQVVAWALRAGRWTRWVSPVVTRGGALQEAWLRSQQLLGNEPEQLAMWDGIESWQIYFYRGNAWSNAQSSADVAPPSGAASAPVRLQLPNGVRLVLSLKGAAEGQPGVTLTRDVVLLPQGA